VASIFAIADNAMMLSKENQGIVEIGRPAEMAQHSPHEEVRQFLNRLPRVHSGATTIYVKN
jgi:ABC-type transporter Mla maintaining outer membrane lipid asymmetry ATPase subunit MlaF